MPISNQPSTRRLLPSNILAPIIALLGFLGFLDASYLTAEHYFTLPLPCSLTRGCDTVLTSSYATIAGIPVAIFGVLYYLTILFCAVYLFTSEKPVAFVTKLLFTIVSLGVLASAALFYLQAFVIHAFCMYCLGSATLTFLLFILVVLLKKSIRNEPQTPI